MSKQIHTRAKKLAAIRTARYGNFWSLEDAYYNGWREGHRAGMVDALIKNRPLNKGANR